MFNMELFLLLSTNWINSFSRYNLLDFKSTEVEETLWACLLLLEENKRLLQKYSKEQADTSRDKRLAENQQYIDRLRGMLRE